MTPGPLRDWAQPQGMRIIAAMPPRIPRAAPALLAGLALLFASPASFGGSNVYRWVDAQGRVHYGDNAPPNAQKVVVAERLADPGALAAIEEVPYGRGTDIYINNNLAGPLEIRLDMSSSSNVQTLPSLPIQQLIGPRQRVLVTRLEFGAGGASYTPRLNLVPGDPRAFPDDKVYSLPVPDDSGWQLGQAFHGGFSHTDEQNLYAVDLIVPQGTPILAARSGVVMQVESAFDQAGLDAKKYAERANLIRILHEDGSMAVYAHLAENGSYVRVGQKVSLGQQIGVSGNTGFSSGPHLHFCLQINTGLRLVSIPFRMVSGRGFLNLPRK